jgi:hypothetical protein
MSLKTNIDNIEKAFGPGNEARFAQARKIAGVTQDADRSPAYEDFPAGDRDAPQLFPNGGPKRFGPMGSAPFSGQWHLSGVEEIANSTSTKPGNKGDR